MNYKLGTIKLLPKIKHWLKKFLFGVTYINWIPGEAPPPPLTGDAMEKVYRTMVDNGVIKYGEPVFVETYKKRGRKSSGVEK